MPFWAAFGAWFEFRPVYECRGGNERKTASWTRLGDHGPEAETECFVFVAKRRRESYSWAVPETNDALLNEKGDSTFETMLLMTLK